ncbi:MAG: hypothetical protein IK093_12485 [Ruminiclostridium sp.]|nr:hypothetical protein [Ruminiclostridium sp.]
MRKHFIPALALSAVFTISGCTESGRLPDSTKVPVLTSTGAGNTDMSALPENEIFLISERTNYAWGHEDHGIFLDTSGNVYSFDFAGSGYGLEGDITLRDKLELFRKYTAPAGHLDEGKVTELYNTGISVAPDAATTDISKMCDYGQDTLYFYDSKQDRKIQCYSDGDVERISLDISANLFKIQWDTAKPMIQPCETVKASLLSAGEAYIHEYPSDDLKTEGNYLLFDQRQLSVLAGQCGVPIDGILDDLDEYRREGSVFFVSLTKSSPAASGIMRFGDNTYDFVYLSDEQKPVCHVAAYSADTGLFSYVQYTDPAGGEWKMLPDYDPNFDSRVYSGHSYGAADGALSRIFKNYNINNRWGMLIDNEADYNSFVTYCDSIGLLEDTTSVRDKLEAECQPDFGNYVLCIKFLRRYPGQTYEQNRIAITEKYRYIDMGDSVIPNDSSQTGDCIDGVILWLWLPVGYISPEKNYKVC